MYCMFAIDNIYGIIKPYGRAKQKKKHIYRYYERSTYNSRSHRSSSIF